MSLTIRLIPESISVQIMDSIAQAIEEALLDAKYKQKDYLKKYTNEVDEINEVTETVTYEILETNIKDEALLEKALKHFKYDIKIGDLEEEEGVHDLIFFLNENKNFSVAYDSQKKAKYLSVIAEIQKEYIKNVQEEVYKNVLKNHEEYGFILENEYVEDDNSVVLTFDTGDRK